MVCFILQEKALAFGRDEGPYGLIVVPSVSITCGVQVLQTEVQSKGSVVYIYCSVML